MAQFLYRIVPTRLAMLSEGATPEEDAIIDAHFQYLQRLLTENVLILAGRTLLEDDRTFGIVIFEASGEPAAQEIMRNDPAVHGGVMKAELFPYRVALMRSTGE
jgi:uncharacterized protein